MNSSKQIKHLYARAGFGIGFEDNKETDASIKQAVAELFNSSAISQSLNIVKDDTSYAMIPKADASTRKMFAQQQRDEEKNLNLGWMDQMSTTRAQLREKMTLFWHNHFACRTINATYAQQLNNIHRDNALGNFKTMTLQVAKAPAMLQFLNNQQNLKGHPNENFARELMELFTIGRGNYTEDDIKNSARAFTGWGFNRVGEFVQRPVVHDGGIKTFMGKTGNFNGDDIINILFEKKETARFICNKLYKYLVNETPDAAHVNAMADVFYTSNYEIKPLLEYVFTANWFYEDKNIGNLIKSPVELMVGLNRQFNISYQRPEVMLQFQRTLGQLLFYPPNVAGWPGGKNWIDSSSLMYRIKIPSTVLNGGVIDFKGKADPDDEAFLAGNRMRQEAVNTRVQAQPDWDRFLKAVPRNWSKADVAQFMLEPKLNTTLLNTINKAADIKALAIEVVSTPEYQLC